MLNELEVCKILGGSEAVLIIKDSSKSQGIAWEMYKQLGTYLKKTGYKTGPYVFQLRNIGDGYIVGEP